MHKWRGGSCGLYSKGSHGFTLGGVTQQYAVLLQADAVLSGLLGDSDVAVVFSSYSVQGRGCCWEKQPSLDNAAAALTKNRILCLI